MKLVFFSFPSFYRKGKLSNSFLLRVQIRYHPWEIEFCNVNISCSLSCCEQVTRLKSLFFEITILVNWMVISKRHLRIKKAYVSSFYWFCEEKGIRMMCVDLTCIVWNPHALNVNGTRNICFQIYVRASMAAALLVENAI